jgi:hypothetical protein
VQKTYSGKTVKYKDICFQTGLNLNFQKYSISLVIYENFQQCMWIREFND